MAGRINVVVQRGERALDISYNGSGITFAGPLIEPFHRCL